ncbi:MAG: adenylosuccinate lyase [Brevinematales bacterium]|nr:adenylosuccinate lyase [Brevinematales bacterium]
MGIYQNPLETRYASREMLEIFSEQTKFLTWRDCWIALAEAEKELGLPISDEQIEDLKRNRENLNLERAKAIEKEIHHDVMSHIRAYGEVAPKAAGIIHLGATSCFVTDNTDVILWRKALHLIQKRLVAVIRVLRNKAWEYRHLPVLGYTHLQPAQPTTLGKRISLWLYDFVLDLQELEYRQEHLMLRGVKGTTGTQASFMELFEGDRAKVRELDKRVAQKLGFDRVVPVSGQTLTRKLDVYVLELLSHIAQTAHRASNDIRLMQHSWQVEEPFDTKQVGSSAMPYKRNPILAERITSLARYVINNVQNAAYTYANQFLERTLDDSANRRISIAEGFLATDAILILCQRLFSGMQVYPQVIHRIMMENLPFYATENILMEATKRGGNRQILHEVIREYAMKQVEAVREGRSFDMLQALRDSGLFNLPQEVWEKISDLSQYVGRAPWQVEELIAEHVDPLLEKYKEEADPAAEIRV